MIAVMRSILSLLMLAASASTLHAASTVWTFANPANPLTASSGPAELSYYDPFADGWVPSLTSFGKASAPGLPFSHSSTGLDGRFSLDSSLLFFGDEDGENNSVHVGMLALYNGPLTGAEITALGATRAEGLFATPSLAITRTGNDIRLAWPATPGYLLERSSNPATPWTPLESTLNASSCTEPYSPAPGRAFVRLAPR